MYLWVGLAFSLAAHAGLWLWLHAGATKLVAQPRGVVSVEFLTAVSHHPSKEPVVAKKPRQSHPQSDLATSASDVKPTNQPVGDPGATEQSVEPFLASVSQILNRNKIYPRAALDREEEGRVTVGLTLARDGHVMDARIEEASPFSRLNEAALQTVKSIKDFPPVPDSIAVPLHLHIPLNFKLDTH